MHNLIRWFGFVVLFFGFILNSSAQAPFDRTADDLNGSWQLVKFAGSDDKTLTPGDAAQYTIHFERSGNVSLQIDCNRGHGMWKSETANQLEFGAIALTRAMCPPSPLNERLPKDLSYVRSYTLKDGHLFLALMADGGIYEFERLTPDDNTKKVLRGTATYRERMALPAESIFEATLEDFSKADAPADVLGSVRLEKPGNPPFHFEIPYDEAQIQANHRYVVRARIVVGEMILFATVENYPVLKSGHSDEVNLLLKRYVAKTIALERTDWKLIWLADAAVTFGVKQRPHLTLNPQGHRASGSGGCNRFTGSYELNGNQLKFGRVVGTMMACKKSMDMERAFLEAFGKASNWRATDGKLELLDAGGKILARFEARQVK